MFDLRNDTGLRRGCLKSNPDHRQPSPVRSPCTIREHMEATITPPEPPTGELANRAWEVGALNRIRAEPTAFPLAVPMTDQEVREVVSSEATRLHEVARSLHETYGTPDLGNQQDPVDELVYIILSRRTREAAYQAAFSALKARYASWDDVAAAPHAELAQTINASGLAQKKASSIQNALRALQSRFGSCTLEPTLDWGEEELVELLCSLDEVGPKSALCVLLMAFGRSTFPVDAHVGRALSRLRPYETLGLDLHNYTHKVRQRLLPDVIPPDARKALHINLLVLGRTTCVSGRPRCAQCAISASCSLGRDKATSSPMKEMAA